MKKIEKQIKEAAQACAQSIMGIIGTATIEELAKLQGEPQAELTRRPGRPPSTKTGGRRPGRPKGSKNKRK